MNVEKVPEVFTCWKEIASYLGKGVRTVQRWEQELGLPVRRPDGPENSNKILAVRQEIDEWRGTRWTRRKPYVRKKEHVAAHGTDDNTRDLRITTLHEKLKQTGYQVLLSQVELALTYLEVARLACTAERRMRSRLNAEKALKNIVHLRGLLEVSPAKVEQLDGKLIRLKNELRSLSGEDRNNLLEAIVNLEYLVKVSGSGELGIAYAAKLDEYRGWLIRLSA